jgi:hypothetical protein
MFDGIIGPCQLDQYNGNTGNDIGSIGGKNGIGVVGSTGYWCRYMLFVAGACTALILVQCSVGWPRFPYPNLVGGRRTRCELTGCESTYVSASAATVVPVAA